MDNHSFILFEVAGTTYGIASRDVQQMEMIDHITPLPNAPDYVDGVVFTRGQVIPAVNLRVRFGFERTPGTSPHTSYRHQPRHKNNWTDRGFCSRVHVDTCRCNPSAT